MVKRRAERRLHVVMNGRRIGEWRLDSGVHRFGYDPDWFAAPDARPLSLSLPLLHPRQSHRGAAVERFFENLLPDDPAMRERMKRRHGARSTSTFDLLTEAGRDCVGAIQLLAPDASIDAPTPWAGRPLDDADIAALLRATRAGVFPGQGIDDGFRISLAGAQEKTALLQVDGRWYEPEGSTPTTHILKLPLGRVGMEGIDLSTSVPNEWLCLKLLGEIGLPVASASIARFEDQQVLVVERFDRRFASDGRTLLRLPQEDACQALGLASAEKYEIDGGPGIERMMALCSGSRAPQRDRERFFTAQLMFWLLAAPDGHAKNFSLFLEPSGRFSMTPLYDVMSVWPYLGGAGLQRQKVTLAMGWHGRNRRFRWHEVTLRHVQAMAQRCGIDAALPELLQSTRERTSLAIDRIGAALPADCPAAVAEPILQRTQQMLTRLAPD